MSKIRHIFWKGVIALFFVNGQFTYADPSYPPSSLLNAASVKGMQIGTAVKGEPNDWSALLKHSLLTNFNLITPENILKFAYIHPAEKTYTFDKVDKVVEFARTHSVHIRGHTLLWHKAIPQWVVNISSDKKRLKVILKDHIQTVVKHFSKNYPGIITYWDVINEALTDHGSRNSIWSSLDADPLLYIEDAFRWAHDADPKVKLFYNDYAIEGRTPKRDQLVNLLKRLKSKGVPINGVGFQMHLTLGNIDSPTKKEGLAAEFAETLKIVTALGLEVHISEMDVAIPKARTEPMAELLREQSEVYYQFAKVCLSIPKCKVFSTWGVADHLSWILDHSDGKKWKPLLLDENFAPKPAYLRLIDAFR